MSKHARVTESHYNSFHTIYGFVIVCLYSGKGFVMHFLKGSQQVINQGDEIPNWAEQADKVRRQMSELFDAQNLSFLFGSGCSSMRKDDQEHGIPTMGPLAGEFKSWFEGMPNPNATVRLSLSKYGYLAPLALTSDR